LTDPWPFDPLRPFCADIIVADPPWQFELRSAKGERKSAQAHYACMSLPEIEAMPVGMLARRDCWLFLWATAPMLPDALATMRAWGFRYVSRTSWRKTTESGKTRMGPGYIVRTMHEDILIGRIGEPTRRRPMPSLFSGVAREHSRKPDEFYALLETFAEPTAFKLDLFGRETKDARLGWSTWGDERTKFDQERQ
jgi:N6-adenosine-specific RNA methylase IME4